VSRPFLRVSAACWMVSSVTTLCLSPAISVFFALAAGLGLVSLLTSFGGGVLPASVMAVLYPTIQPAGRFLTGVWLWRGFPEDPA